MINIEFFKLSSSSNWNLIKPVAKVVFAWEIYINQKYPFTFFLKAAARLTATVVLPTAAFVVCKLQLCS